MFFVVTGLGGKLPEVSAVVGWADDAPGDAVEVVILRGHGGVLDVAFGAAEDGARPVQEVGARVVEVGRFGERAVPEIVGGGGDFRIVKSLGEVLEGRGTQAAGGRAIG